MSDVEFEDRVDLESQLPNEIRAPKGMVGILIRLGLVKTEVQANVFLVVLGVLFLGLAIFILRHFLSGN